MRIKKRNIKDSTWFIRSAALSQLNIFKVFRLTSHVSRLTVFALFAFLAGCAAQQKAAKERYFFPPPPEAPRIEWIATYATQHDFPKTGSALFAESLVGRAEPKTFDRPWGIASDGQGKVFVADTNAGVLVVYDLNRYTIETVGEDVLAKPMGVGMDSDGNVYVSDAKKAAVYVFDKDLRPLHQLGEGGTLSRPSGLSVNDKLKRLYVADSRNHNIVVFDLSDKSKPPVAIGSRGTGEGQFNFPVDVAIDSKDNLIVSDSLNARIQILDKDGRFISKFGERGSGLGFFKMIKGVAVSKDDNIYVVDGQGDDFSIFKEDGTYLLTVGGTFSTKTTRKPGIGGLFIPSDVFIDKNNTVYITDSMNRRFQVYQVVDEEWLKKHPIEK